MEYISISPFNNPKIIRAWAFFDWANSAYALVISVAIFPSFFSKVTAAQINIGGSYYSNSAVFSFSITLSYFLLALFSPALSGIADYGGKKKLFMKIFTHTGGLACITMFFFEGNDQLWLGLGCFILATIGFAGSLVFYNSYLPLIASEDKYDSVSAKGFAYGYVGSIILLILNLIVILFPTKFGIAEGTTLPARIAFVMVGVWWIGFAQIAFRDLPAEVERSEKLPQLIKHGFGELQKVWLVVKNRPNIKGFLFSFLAYNAGVQTVLFLASTFAEKELHFETAELIGIILILQVLAIGGAYLFAKISDLKGNKFTLLLTMIIWAVICFLGYFIYDKTPFYLLACGVGLVMGGIQSLSRSTYSKLIPQDTLDTASYFSFYDVIEKIAIIIGTLSFGIIDQVTGNMHISLLAMAMFFFIGIFLMTRIKIEK